MSLFYICPEVTSLLYELNISVAAGRKLVYKGSNSAHFCVQIAA